MLIKYLLYLKMANTLYVKLLLIMGHMLETFEYI